MVTFSCFRMATFRPATRKYDTFHASPFRLLFVVSLPGGAKGRHAKTRLNHHLAGFRVAIFRPARRKREKAPRENPPNGEKSLFGGFSRGDISPRQAKTRKVDTRKPTKRWLFRVFAWRPFAPPHESTRHSMRWVFDYCFSYHCLAVRKVAMRKLAKITIRLFAPKTRLYDMAQISHHVFIPDHKLNKN